MVIKALEKLMTRPIFIKGNIEFTVDDVTLSFTHKNISAFGISGLSWSTLSPQKYFGTVVLADVELSSPEPYFFATQAILLREQTPYAEYMGLKFTLTSEERNHVSGLIKNYGFYPTEYARKYPRIPYSAKIQTFPYQIISQSVDKDMETPPLVFNIQNLSIGGVLVSCENPFGFSIQPGQRFILSFQPRGDFSVHISVQGMICRVMEDVDPVSGNIIRLFGIKFTKVDEENRVAFLELLKDILTRLKEFG